MLPFTTCGLHFASDFEEGFALAELGHLLILYLPAYTNLNSVLQLLDQGIPSSSKA